MRFFRILLIGLMTCVLLSVCTRSDFVKTSYNGLDFGTYIFKKVSHLSLLSSSTPDYVNAVMKGTEYTITSELFVFKTEKHTIEINNPRYVKEEIKNEIKNDSFVSYDVHNTIGNDVGFQYAIYDKYGARTHWRLYVSGDRVWIAFFADNTRDDPELIMNIYELSKRTESN